MEAKGRRQSCSDYRGAEVPLVEITVTQGAALSRSEDEAIGGGVGTDVLAEHLRQKGGGSRLS